MTLSYQTKRAAHALASEVKDKEEDTKMMTELTGESDTKKVVVNHRSPMKGRYCKGYSCENTDIGEDENKGVKAENRVRVPTREEDKEKSQMQKHLTREKDNKRTALSTRNQELQNELHMSPSRQDPNIHKSMLKIDISDFSFCLTCFCCWAKNWYNWIMWTLDLLSTREKVWTSLI